MEATPQTPKLKVALQLSIAGLNLDIQVELSKQVLLWLLGALATGGIAIQH
jgi:hypothetical protein